jgi:hypothetical protein
MVSLDGEGLKGEILLAAGDAIHHHTVEGWEVAVGVERLT